MFDILIVTPFIYSWFRQLQEGNLLCNGVTDGAKITLLPNVETGLIVSIYDHFILITYYY